MKYPTPEEIMRYPPKYPLKIIEFTLNWKKIWQKYPSNKYLSLIALAYGISDLYNKPVLSVTLNNEYCYNSKTKTIALGYNPSIISTLHEIGHHLYGHSELKACRFSIHLFKQTFPKAFQKLSWKDHTLIIKKETM